MKYWTLDWTSWTNYYIPVSIKLPMIEDNKKNDHKEIKLMYYPVNCFIIGKPGKPNITKDFDLFMSDAIYVYPFYANLDRDEIKNYPNIEFNESDIISWILKSSGRDRLKEQLRMLKK